MKPTKKMNPLGVVVTGAATLLIAQGISPVQVRSTSDSQERKEAKVLSAPKTTWPKRPWGTYEEFVYETVTVGDYTFKGISISVNGQNPLNRSRFVTEENKYKEAPIYHVYRIYQRVDGRESLIREVWNDELPKQLAHVGCDWDEGRCGGPEFLALNEKRIEAYFTIVGDAGRVVSRELFSVSLVSKEERYVGRFWSAGDNHSDVRISPSGRFLSLLGLGNSEVTHSLEIFDVENGKKFTIPFREEVTDKSGNSLKGSLGVTEYSWTSENKITYRQKFRPQSATVAEKLHQEGRKSLPEADQVLVFDPTTEKNR